MAVRAGKENDMKINNLIQIKGYEAGKNGNLLVALDEELVQKQNYATDKKTYNIRMLVTTANVTTEEGQRYLRKFTDGTVDCSRIIIVNKKFLHLFNKTQLILLAERNHREDVIENASCDEEVVSYGHVQTISQYGKMRSTMAFNKERKIMEHDEKKAGGALKSYNKRELKKIEKAAKKGTPPAEQCFDDQEIEEFEEGVKDIAKRVLQDEVQTPEDQELLNEAVEEVTKTVAKDVKQDKKAAKQEKKEATAQDVAKAAAQLNPNPA